AYCAVIASKISKRLFCNKTENKFLVSALAEAKISFKAANLDSPLIIGFSKNNFNSLLCEIASAMVFISALTISAFPFALDTSRIALAYLKAALVPVIP